MSDSNLTALRMRSELGSLRERDIDLLLCMELHADAELVEYFADQMGLPANSFKRAWVSVYDGGKESDLVVSFSTTHGCSLLLLENKIDASFTPDQPKGYETRAKGLRKEKGVEIVRTAILAPSEYLKTKQDLPFDLTFYYEDLLEVLEQASDGRSNFLASQLRDGIKKKQSVSPPHHGVSQTWSLIYRLCQEHTPSLNMKPPDKKPSGANWVEFNNKTHPVDGMESYSGKIFIVWKADKEGYADLAFSSTSREQLLSAVKDYLEPKMKVHKAGKSAVIRIKVPTVDFERYEDTDEETLIECLQVCERLRGFFVKHKSRLGSLSDLPA
ncbi:hypothetical protein [Nitratireductor sp. XY-223]|uniref:hypothetical protein n=1 Tax=Nitratireductor sp. XY-223 TaxID=2561926 RepID=UPI0010AB41C8|nr:hypothetical protein [Nitratireductor sp. XY-223]